ncbi:DUF4174 domain-containing protein [Glaciecola siphonariae]|uniref:DUF4174 domain-containing protein n=1 Tax=Glaciecola siphonariae TaxID=521012 RepID=A0ABV9LYI1_9ALTE
MNNRNKIFVTLCGLFLLQNTAISFQGKRSSTSAVCGFLSSLHWQYRSLVIPLGSANPNAELLVQLNQNKAAIEERRLRVMFVTNSHLIIHTGQHYDIETAKTCRNIVTQDANKRPFLVGLDGGLKSIYEVYEEDRSFDLKAVFADIDGMPMRKAELTGRKY